MPTVDAQLTLYIQGTLSGVMTRTTATLGIRGRFSLVGPTVLSTIFTPTAGLQTPQGEHIILRTADAPDPSSPQLSLDYVKHAHPFAWGRTGDPPLLTLDVSRHGHPFATNDIDTTSVFADRLTLTILANLNGDYRVFVPPPPTLVEGGELTLDIRASFTGVGRLRNNLTLQVLANTTQPPWTKRTVLPCEIPGGIPEISSNLPYNIWQENPEAQFTWSVLYACSRYNQNEQVPVDGYMWTITKTPATVGSYGWTFTTGNIADIDLSQVPPYGTGRWYFHVCGFTYAGLGPIGTYIVCYNHRPVVPPGFEMYIDGMDSLYSRPHVAYNRPPDHLLEWTPFSDADPDDSLNYDVEIGTVFDFSVNVNTGSPDIETTLANLPQPSGYITQTLEPGVHYWRIRATDGNEISEWSPIGSFTINAPPEKPFDLEVRSIKSAFVPLYVQASASGNIQNVP